MALSKGIGYATQSLHRKCPRGALQARPGPVTDSLLLTAACIGSIGGVATLRYAWALPRRSMAVNSAGWLLLLTATGLAWNAAGAWGASIASLAAMTAAFVALTFAAATSPPAKQKASNRRVRMLPEKGEPLRIGGRIATFLLVAVVAALLSVALAIAIGHAARLGGWSEANSTVVALASMPVIWAVIAFFMTMQTRRSAQIKVMALAGLPLVPILALGALS